MANGTYFKTIIGDKTTDPSSIDTVVFVSGKHYYELDKQRRHQNKQNVAIVRLEVSGMHKAKNLAGK